MSNFLSRTWVNAADLRRPGESTRNAHACPQVMHSQRGVSAPGIHRTVHRTLCADGWRIARLEAPVNQEERAEVYRRNLALGRAARTEIAEERCERYCQLRRGGYSIQEAAWELRVSRRQADRYEARRKGET